MDVKDRQNPSIVRRFLLRAKLELKSPLLIGTGENDNLTDTLVLKDKNGIPFIPGTSLAGVLRGYSGEDEEFFGDLKHSQSTIVVSDVKLNNAKTVIRDGVKIDSVTNIGVDRAKFDYEAVERGATGDLQIVAHVRQYQNADAVKKKMEQIGRLLLTGIRVGALTRRGFGRIVGHDVMLDDYDFSKSGNIRAWLLRNPAVERNPIDGEGKREWETDDFVMELVLNIKTSLLVRSDDFEESDYKEFIKNEKGQKMPISSVQMKSLDDFVIPGASVRGVIRNRAERILRALDLFDKQRLDDLFGCPRDNGGQRGRVITEEVYIDNGRNYPQSRNRIDRFTGGTMDGALMTNLPILQDKPSDLLIMRIVVEECKADEAGLMLLVAKDICTGQVAFGGEKSIGRGVMNGVEIKIDFKGETYGISCADEKVIVHPDNAEKLEGYVASLCNGGLNEKN